MPDAPPQQNESQSSFESAVVEMRRLEGIAVKRSGEQQAFATEPLFDDRSAQKLSISDYPAALKAALRVEHGIRPAPPLPAAFLPPQVSYEEAKRKREQEDLRRMQEKFRKLEEQGKVPSNVAATQVGARLPLVPPAQAGAPQHSSEAERLQLMRQKLAGIVKRRQGAAAAAQMLQTAEIAAPPAEAAPLPAEVAAPQPPPPSPEERAEDLKERLARKVRAIKEREKKAFEDGEKDGG